RGGVREKESDGRGREAHARRARPEPIAKDDDMLAVIFEVIPAAGRKEQYLELAAQLRPELEKIDGFISVERFASLTDESKLLSLSFWRDEEAVRRWRNLARHREAQARGRSGVFADYRLRIASVVRDYGMNDRAEAPQDSRAVHQA